MQTFLHTIATALMVPVMAISGWFGGHTDQNLSATAAIETPVALFETTLASAITTSATTMTLASATTKDGTTLSGTYSFIIDEGTTNQEFVRADCTSTACTGLERGISVVSGTTTVAALQMPHRRGATVKITDAPILLNLTRIINGIGTIPNALSYTSNFSISSTSRQLIAAYQALGMANTASTSAVKVSQTQDNAFTGTNTHAGTETFNAASTFNAAVSITATTTSTKSMTVGYGPTANLDVATKKYVDDTSVAGASNASETVKGIIELSTNAEAALGTSSGGTSARLVLPGSIATSTSQVAQNSVVVTKSTGKIDPSFLNGSSEEYTMTALNLTRSTTTNATTTNFYASGSASTTALRANSIVVGSCLGCATITRVTSTNSGCDSSSGSSCSQTITCAGSAIAVGGGGTSNDGSKTGLVSITFDGAQNVVVTQYNRASNAGASLTGYAMCLQP